MCNILLRNLGILMRFKLGSRGEEGVLFGGVCYCWANFSKSKLTQSLNRFSTVIYYSEGFPPDLITDSP